MDGSWPFRPSGSTFALGVTGTANPSATLLGSGLSGDVVARFYNSGGADAFMGYGPTSTAAQANAVIPVLSGGPQPVMIIKSGETREFTLAGQPQIFVAAIALAGSCTLYATPGFGIA